MLSGLTIVFMLCIVLASVIGVIVYRVFASVDYCPHMPPEACVMVTTVVSSLLNTISILILSKVIEIYKRIAWQFWIHSKLQVNVKKLEKVPCPSKVLFLKLS